LSAKRKKLPAVKQFFVFNAPKNYFLNAILLRPKQTAASVSFVNFVFPFVTLVFCISLIFFAVAGVLHQQPVIHHP
jgi:hypothetical protein